MKDLKIKNNSKSISPIAPNKGWYQKSVNEIEKELSTEVVTGLSTSEAHDRITRYGQNKLPEPKQVPWYLLFLKGLLEPLSIVLLVTAIIVVVAPYFAGGHPEWVEFGVILGMIFINTLLGMTQELKARSSVKALQRLSNPNATVIRSGKQMEISAHDLVPGDIVILQTGEFIPADIRLISSSHLTVDESALTGESMPVVKNTEVLNDATPILAEQKNLVFMSTFVQSGRATGIVVEQAPTSTMGKIASTIAETKAQKTPLQLKLNRLTKWVSVIATVTALFLFGLLIIIDIIRADHSGIAWSENLLLSVSSAIAIIPASLTVIVSIILSVSTNQMSKQNVIVKQLQAVETLGKVNVICSDKTGTLTINKMTVTKYNQVGVTRTANNFTYVADDIGDIHFVNALTLCNDSIVNEKNRMGLPTELALYDWMDKMGFDPLTLRHKYMRIDDVPFSSDNKYMVTVNQVDDKKVVYVKGAIDRILQKCSRAVVGGEIVKLTPQIKKQVLENAEKMSGEALRVITTAFKYVNDADMKSKDYVSDLVLTGIVGMIDPPREEAISAIKIAHRAGIRVVMITGDHLATAMAIGEKLGLVREGFAGVTGEDLDKMSDEELTKRIDRISVFARVNPDHKTRIVTVLQEKGLIVAMTGDGINDAPSLRKANVGIAMGMNGTEAAKDAANVILADDNFSTIVAGVSEGRNSYRKIKTSVAFVLGANPQIIAMFLIILITGVSPLNSINILWFNLIVETILAIPIGMSKSDPNVMNLKPIKNNESIFAGIWSLIFVTITSTGIAVILAFVAGFYIFPGANPVLTGQTAAFITIAFSPIFFVWMMKFRPEKKERRISYKERFKNANWALFGSMLGAFTLNVIVVFVPGVRGVFKISSLNWQLWLSIAILTISPAITIALMLVIKTQKIRNQGEPGFESRIRRRFKKYRRPKIANNQKLLRDSTMDIHSYQKRRHRKNSNN
ncbi:cation-transporting ATPase [Spiroplasma sabaudiense Ar-1343]|uniref:Cation-transporting ATPase n=1 Tax=Spiroplasma sabaudiense Ar-1343 TaxID=1276257 RepID=W6A9A1_9MOLU|nr:cation-translocating P-type ATPase [Spiroplasma sabaudiense]AHI53470.1 cation-transporting ATPase [Spiroplasma sabaudiense Ar-1343]